MKFNIPNPCHESWQSMTPDGEGRFCQKCAKTVVDFTRHSRQEFEQYMASQKGRICGRVPAAFLYQPVSKPGYFNAIERLRIFVLAFLMVFGAASLGISKSNSTLLQQEITAAYAPNLAEKGGDRYLRGRVYDTYAEDPAAAAIVSVFFGDELIDRVYADENGEFSIFIHPKYGAEPRLMIEVAWVGRKFAESYQGDLSEILELQVESVESEYLLETVQISAWKGSGILQGDLINVNIRLGTYRDYPGIFGNGRFQQTIEDRLQMNNSEIKYIER